ncbi:MAG: HDOD domain-containing protein [Mycobacteriales bacterium]
MTSPAPAPPVSAPPVSAPPPAAPPPAALPPAALPPAAPLPRAVRMLLGDLHRLPGQRPALLRVVQVTDDPDSSARELADAAALDPAFAARLLQLANSAYYGRMGQITAIGPAVSALGAETLRGLAVTMALGLSGEHGPLPHGFWDRAATTAAASRLVAPRVGADSGDAFCVGLLCEVGQALLFRAAPEMYSTLLAAGNEAALAAAELEWCGTTNGELAAAVLGASGLPAQVCRAIARHQGVAPVPGQSVSFDPLTRALRAGVLLARAVATGEVDEKTSDALAAVVGGTFDETIMRKLALRTAAHAAALSATMR